MVSERIRKCGRATVGTGVLIGLLAAASASVAFAQWGNSFPGAEGLGSRAAGGRGGSVLIVDSLEDKVSNSPVGTLRWALEQTGRRIVVFRVAGTIELEGKLILTEPHVTIAGQTAPGGGITLRDFPLEIQAKNVILQGIRVRLGAGPLVNSDALIVTTSAAHDVIVDHCSFSWSTDEVAGVGNGAYNLTFQNSIFSEGLDCSNHPEGCHSRGFLTSAGSRHMTFHGNYFAHNDFRNPKMFGDPAGLGGATAIFDYYNNVIYDWRTWAVAGAGRSRVNIENNTFKLGPSSSGYPDNQEIISTDETEGYRLWADGNIGPSCPTGCADDWEEMVDSTADQYRAPRRNRTPPGTILSAQESRPLVMADAGASYRLDNNGLRVPRRDAVDLRVVADFWAGTGGIINDPAEVGGWPDLSPGTPVVDSDLDGMPDAWELLHGLDPLDSSDATQNLDGDLYTNVEEYLFESDPSVAEVKSSARSGHRQRRLGRTGGTVDRPGRSVGRRHRARRVVEPGE